MARRQLRISSAARFVVEQLETRSLLSGLDVSSHTFAYQTGHTLTIGFNKSVGSSFNGDDTAIENLTTGAVIANSRKTVSTAGGAYTVSISPTLEDGNYESNLISDGITATDGSTLSDDNHLDFFVLAADANHDRVVDGTDQSILFSNYGATGVGFSGGDFDYSGQVNMSDFNLLAGHYGTTLQEAPSSTWLYSIFTQNSSTIRLQWFGLFQWINEETGEVFGTNPDGYRLYRSTDGVNFAQIAQTTGVSYLDTGLADGTKYWYRVRPYTNAAGNGPSLGRTSSVTTLPAPTNLSLSDVQDNSVTLQWQDNSTSEAGFTIQRSVNGGAFANFATVGSNITSFNATGLSEDTNYAWRVVASNSVAVSATSIAQSVTTNPAAPTDVTVSGVRDTSLFISWQDNSLVETGYVVQRATNLGPFDTTYETGANQTTLSVTGLDSATHYSWRVYAAKATVNSPSSGIADGSTLDDPAAKHLEPQIVSATGTTSSGLQLSGSVATGAYSPDSLALSFKIITAPTHGSLTNFNATTGAYTYTAKKEYVGSDSFTFRASDGTANSNLANVAINVIGGGRIAQDDYAQFGKNSVEYGVIEVYTNDIGERAQGHHIVIDTPPQHGDYHLYNENLSYKPNSGFSGTDSFTYHREYPTPDGVFKTNVATVTIDVIDEGSPLPSKLWYEGNSWSMSYSTHQGIPLTQHNVDNFTWGVLRGFAENAQITSLTAALVSGPGNGSLTLESDGEFTYAPSMGFAGVDRFSFRATDQDGRQSDPVWVSLRVYNNTPNSTNLGNNVLQGQTVVTPSQYSPYSATADQENDPITWSIVEPPKHGTFTRNSDNGYTYSSQMSFVGFDWITLRPMDAVAGGMLTTVLLNVGEIQVDLVAYKGHELGDGSLTDAEEDGNGPGWYVNVNWDDDDADGWNGNGWKPDGTLDPNFQGQVSLNPTYTPDKDDSEIAPQNGNGDDDLWLLRLNAAPLPENPVGTIKLTFSDKIKIWGTNTKKTAGGASSEIASGSEVPLAQLAQAKYLYVEGVSGSGALRDIDIKAELVGGKEIVNSDLVKTSVFEVTWHGFFGDANGGAQAQQTDNEARMSRWHVSNDTTGIISNTDDPISIMFHNCMELQGAVAPPDIVNLPVWIQPQFDLHREVWLREYSKTAVGWMVLARNGEPSEILPWGDDDLSQDDEDLTPSAQGHIYDIDGPGYTSDQRPEETLGLALLTNFRQLCSVKLYARDLTCSDYFRWHSQVVLDASGQPGKFKRAAGLQKLGSGWIEIPALVEF
jgi:hypothetical protein